MRISFSPQRRDDTLSIRRDGDILYIGSDDIAIDLTDLPDGATGEFEEPPSEFIVGPIRRVNGEIELTLIRPHGPNPSQEDAFPQPITLGDGPDNALFFNYPQPEDETNDDDIQTESE